MFRGTFVFNKWGARAIEMPSQCRAPFSFKGRVCCRRPELSAALPSTPLHLSTLFHTTANTKHFTPGGWPVTPGVTDLQWDHCCRVIQLFHPSTPSCHPRHHLSPKTQIQRRPTIVDCVETVCPSKALLTLLIIHWCLYWGWRECCRGI